MPNNKRQHYVPQLLLRNFSINAEGKQIGLYNLRADRFVPDAKLSRQAYEDYYYGKDGQTEHALRELESDSANIIKRILLEKRLPPWNSHDYSILIMFLVTSHARTIAIVDDGKVMVRKLNKQLMLNVPEFSGLADKVHLEIDDPVGWSLSTAVKMHPMLADLKCKLLLNRSRTLTLVLSDHPVVLYNQVFQDVNDHRGHTGYSSKGLQVYLPLTPMAGLFFFDGQMYDVRGKRNRPVQMDNEADIDWLNGLQYLNANETLYFDCDTSQDYIRRLVLRFAKYRREERIEIHQAPLRSPNFESEDEIIHTHKTNIKCGAAFTFVQLSKKGSDFIRHGGDSLLRDPITNALHRKFLRLVESGKRDPDTFWSFVLEETDSIAKSKRNDIPPGKNLKLPERE